MSALRAPVVNSGETFKADAEALRSKYPAINDVVEELSETLKVSWNVPHQAIEGQDNPNVYGAALDYPARGSSGLGVLFVTYHATPEAENKMREPLRTYTLLTKSTNGNPASGNQR